MNGGPPVCAGALAPAGLPRLRAGQRIRLATDGGAFGLQVVADFPLPGLRGRPAADAPEVRLELTGPEVVHAAWSGRGRDGVAELRVDGLHFRAELGVAGDLLLRYGDDAQFHVTPGHDRVLCSPSRPDHPAWRRVLLDTVLWLAALWHGREAVHAAGVCWDRGVVGLVGGTGGGKTTLAAELVHRGAKLFTDDILCLDSVSRAHPGPALMSVTLTSPDTLAAGELGVEAGRIDDEAWVEVRRATSVPLPLAGVVFLHRRAGLATRLVQETPGLPELRRHILAHPFAPSREAGRFGLCADLAARVPMARLEADPAVTPAALAAHVEGFAATLGARA